MRGGVFSHFDLATLPTAQAGTSHPDLDPAASARTLLAQMEGLMILAKAARDPTVIGTFGAAAERLLR